MIEESIDIEAPPERLYPMVSDLSRMGEWSPENRGGKWVGGATGAAALVGDRRDVVAQLDERVPSRMVALCVVDPVGQGFDESLELVVGEEDAVEGRGGDFVDGGV